MANTGGSLAVGRGKRCRCFRNKVTWLVLTLLLFDLVTFGDLACHI